MASNSKKISGFDKLVETYITRLISGKLESNVSPELEIRYAGIVNGEFMTNTDITPITKTEFNNVVRQLVSLHYTPNVVEGVHMLRIYLKKGNEEFPYRCEIYGLRDIQQYCKTNDWSLCSTTRFVKKSLVSGTKGNISDFYSNEYGFKLSLRDEHSVPGTEIHTDPYLKYMKTHWNDYDKAYRQLNRTSFSTLGGLVTVDLSIVKSSTKTDTTQFVYFKELNSSGLYESMETFEIEIEFNNQNIAENYKTSNDIYTYTTNTIIHVREVINIVLCGLYQTAFPITKTEMKYVLIDYYSTVYLPRQDTTINPVSNKILVAKAIQNKEACDTSLFTGPSQVSVQFENIMEDPTVNPLSIITTQYAVSDKADGERCLMYISRYQTGTSYKIYLIDTNMRVSYTGVTAETPSDTPSPAGTLIDGEYVRYDKYGANVNLFLAFDIYNYRFKSVRAAPFIYPENISKTNLSPSRTDYLYDFQTNVNIIFNSPFPTPVPFRFAIKPFLIPDDTHTIFERCREVLGIERPYKNDGLVFAHQHLPVGSLIIGKSGPLMKIRWIYSFKWKPPQFNTIDFLITSPDNNTLHSIDSYGINPAGSDIQFYKKLDLRCGFQFKSHGFANARETAISEIQIAELKLTYGSADYETGYIPMKFYPSWFPSSESNMCHVIVRKEYGMNIMYTEEGDILEPNTIVEFRYDPTGRYGFKWIPLRVRYDKTANYLSGQNAYGNDYVTANNVWKSIHLPITEEIITTGVIPNGLQTIDEVDDYYQMGQDSDDRGVLQRFHNYVKSKLLDSILTKGSTLIDLSCGRGGDLRKWYNSQVSFVFGIDLSKTNIDNRFSGAYARYLQDRLKNDTSEFTRCIFVTGDSSKNIQSGQSFTDDTNAELAKAVYGEPSSYAKVIGDVYGIGRNGFSNASCQFSIHYFFKDINTLQNFIINVSQNLKVDGKFVATCFDGRKVFNMLHDTGDFGEITIMSKNNPSQTYWKCTRKYTATMFNDDSSSLGYAIEVFQKSIGKSFVEYLVNTVYFKRVMEQFGFRLDMVRSFKDIYLNLPKTKFFDKYRELDKLPEKLVTFLNVQYIFTKVIDIDPLTIVLEDLGSAANTHA